MSNTITKNMIAEKLKELFAMSKKLTFFDVPLIDGSILRTTDDALKQGSQVTLVAADGTESTNVEGDHTSAADNSVINVKSGVVSSITPSTDSTSAPASPAPGATAPVASAMAPVQGDAPLAAASATTDNTSTPAPVDGGDGSGDMNSVMDILKNIIDRLSALETASSDTKMTVEKMAAAPAAKPFNYEPMNNNSIGAALDSYKKKIRENSIKQAGYLAEFQKQTKPVPNILNTEFKKDATAKPENDFKFNFGGDFAVGNGAL